jgi:arabinan endo-1,5-alpha-L-arabinosidase
LRLGGQGANKSEYIHWYVQDEISLDIEAPDYLYTNETITLEANTRISANHTVTWNIANSVRNGEETDVEFTDKGNYTIELTEEYNNETYTTTKTIQVFEEVPNDNMVAYYRFEDTNNGLIDYQNNNDGYINSDSNPSLANGIRGNSFDFSNDGITVSDSESLRMNNEITISAWVNPNSCNDHGTVATKQGSYYFQVHSDCTIASYTYHGDSSRSNSDYTYSNTSIPTNEWSHIAFVENNGVRRLYYNGKLVREDNMEVGIWQDNQDLGIGQEIRDSRPFSGLIDEVRIYDSALDKKIINKLSSSD